MGENGYKPALAYHVLTPIYDFALEIFGFGRRFKAEVAEIAHVQPNEVVLDLGCGTGLLLEAIARSQHEAFLFGVDPDDDVLEIAHRRLGEQADLRQAFAQSLPFGDATFDVVVSSLVFHHLPEEVKPQAIREVKRVLKPDGRFVLADFGKPQGIVQTVLLRTGSLFDGRGNMRANLNGEIPSLLSDEGFDPREVAKRHRGVEFLLSVVTENSL